MDEDASKEISGLNFDGARNADAFIEIPGLNLDSAKNEDAPKEIPGLTLDGAIDEDVLKEIPGLNLEALCRVIEQRFDVDSVSLVYLTQGGFHLIYECQMTSCRGILLPQVIARIAFPVFPHDKVASEVATLKYIATYTSVPVPQVYAWDDDASGPVGAEYMLLEKIPGKPAVDIYDQLTFDQRLLMTQELATHLNALYHLRFDCIGSIYMASHGTDSEPRNRFTLGPLVDMTYFFDYEPDARPPNLKADRGPWPTASKWLASLPAAELAMIEGAIPEELARVAKESSIEPGKAKEQMRKGQARLHQLMDMASVYGGVPEDPSLSPNTFSLRLHDFRLSNFMIDEHTGKVTGFIDFEATGTAPLWACTRMPDWLEPPDVSGWPFKSPEDAARRATLREAFLDVVDRLDAQYGTSDSWRGGYERCEPFQSLLFYCQLGWESPIPVPQALSEVLRWATTHPGQIAIFPDDL